MLAKSMNAFAIVRVELGTNTSDQHIVGQG